jgi:hypothetical protein
VIAHGFDEECGGKVVIHYLPYFSSRYCPSAIAPYTRKKKEKRQRQTRTEMRKGEIMDYHLAAAFFIKPVRNFLV